MYKVDVNALRKRMAECNIRTYTELSIRSGIDRNTISKIFSCTVKPTTLAIEKLMLALEIEPEHAGKIFFVPFLRN